MLYAPVSRVAAKLAKLAAILIPPAEFVIVMLAPAVRVATEGAPVVALPINSCPLVVIWVLAAIVSAALAYSTEPLAIVARPVPPFTTAHCPVTVPEKFIEVKNPAELLLQLLKSIFPSTSVITTLSEAVVTVTLASADLIHLNTI